MKKKTTVKRRVRWTAVLGVICAIAICLETAITGTISGRAMLPCGILVLCMLIDTQKKTNKHLREAKKTTYQPVSGYSSEYMHRRAS